LVGDTAFYKPERSLIIFQNFQSYQMSATNKSMYVGIDCSKGYADIIAFQCNKEIAEPAFRLYDINEGYQQLQALISRWLALGYNQIYCGVEGTGGYENNLVNYLQQMGKKGPVHIARLNIGL